MKTTALGSFFVLFALAAGAISAAPAFADHAEVTIEAAMGSGVVGCETTPEGCLIPGTATVDVGGTVIFSNPDTAAHTFTSGELGEDNTGAVFDSSLVLTGATYEWTPTEVGEYPYFCIVHPWMVGTIIVQEAGEDRGVDPNGMMMEGEKSGTGMLSDSTVVSIMASEPAVGQMMEIGVEFEEQEHLNYDLIVMQNGEEVLRDEGVHNHDGMLMHTTAPLASADAVDINIMFQGYGIDEKTGPIGEQVMFTEVMPEFGTIAMMILAVAIISIVAVTSRSRIVPRI